MKSLNSQTNFKNSTELGAVIAESQKRLAKFSAVAVSWMVWGGLIGWVCSFGDYGWRGYGVGFLISAIGVIISALRRSGGKDKDRTLRVLERGLSCLEDEVSTEIQYHEIDEYSCKKAMVCNESIYLHPTFEIELKSVSSNDLRKINWNDTANGGLHSSIDLDALHLRISKSVADKMAAKLQVGQKVPWGNSAFIRQDGIEVEVRTDISSREMRFFAWSELRTMSFQGGKLLLFFGSMDCDVTIPCSEPNLFAGYLLVDEIMKTLYGNWRANKQTEQEVAIAMAERQMYLPPGGF